MMVSNARAFQCALRGMGALSPEERGLHHLTAKTSYKCAHEVNMNPHEMLLETIDWMERTLLPSNSHIL